MAWLYILQSKTTGRFYIGSTNDLPRRLSEHERSHSLATRARGRWELVYQDMCETLSDARRRELQVKNWKSARRIRQLIENSIG